MWSQQTHVPCQGRRAFEKHFEEYKHQNGLKLLGIPNLPAFFDVVRIKVWSTCAACVCVWGAVGSAAAAAQDAMELNKKLQNEEKAKVWDADEMMEMEGEAAPLFRVLPL